MRKFTLSLLPAPIHNGRNISSAAGLNDEWLLRASSHLERGELSEAESLCRESLQTGETFDAVFLFGTVLTRQGKFIEAFQWYQKARILNPNSDQAWLESGKIYAEVEQFHDALICLQQSVQINPKSIEALVARAKVCLRLCLLDEAKLCSQLACKTVPQSDQARNALVSIEKAAASIKVTADNWRAITNGNHSLIPEKLFRREALPYLLNELDLTEKGVEIGVQTGVFSEQILSFWKGSVLYSIDPWRHSSGPEYNDIANVEQNRQNALHQETVSRLQSFGERSVIWRMGSEEAFDRVPDNSLDFCYVDGDHSYTAVQRDVKQWYPKIKPGGLLAGHDYIPDGDYEFGSFGVQRAVRELAARIGAPVFVSAEQVDEFPSWFILKHG